MSSAMDEESDEDIWIIQETFRVNPSENLACDPEFISILNDLKKPPVLDEEKEPYDLVNNAKFVGHLPVIVCWPWYLVVWRALKMKVHVHLKQSVYPRQYWRRMTWLKE